MSQRNEDLNKFEMWGEEGFGFESFESKGQSDEHWSDSDFMYGDIFKREDKEESKLEDNVNKEKNEEEGVNKEKNEEEDKKNLESYSSLETMSHQTQTQSESLKKTKARYLAKEIQKEILEKHPTFKPHARIIRAVKSKTNEGIQIYDTDYVSRKTGEYFCKKEEYKHKCIADRTVYMQFKTFRDKNTFYLKKDLDVNKDDRYLYSKDNLGNYIVPLKENITLSSIEVTNALNQTVVRYFLKNTNGNYDKVLSKNQIIQKNKKNKRSEEEQVINNNIISNKDEYESNPKFTKIVFTTREIIYHKNDGRRIKQKEKVKSDDGSLADNLTSGETVNHYNYIRKHRFFCEDNPNVFVPGGTNLSGLCSIGKDDKCNIEEFLWRDEESGNYRKVVTQNMKRSRAEQQSKQKKNRTNGTDRAKAVSRATKKRPREEKKENGLRTRKRKLVVKSHDSNATPANLIPAPHPATLAPFPYNHNSIYPLIWMMRPVSPLKSPPPPTTTVTPSTLIKK